jgi:LPXTG-site transpeptidase (sortase) family protein
MQHKHHSTHYAAGVILGVLLIGGTLGAVNGLLGNSLTSRVIALNAEGQALPESAEYMLEQARLRRIRRAHRLQREERVVRDVGETYPMHKQSFGDRLLSNQWEVAMNTGLFSYPRLGISAPINRPTITHWKNRNWRSLENQMQYGLLHGVTAYPHSPGPGGKGSMIIAGHSSPPTLEVIGSPYEDVFASLPDAKVGDRIEVFDNQNRSFMYEVYHTAVISAGYTQILLQDPSKQELVAFTCYPVGTTRERFAVWARLVSQASGSKLPRLTLSHRASVEG